MKKAIWLFIFIVLLVTTLFGGKFVWDNFRGSGPAIRPSGRETQRDTSVLSVEQGGEINTTGLPLNFPQGFSVSIFAKNLENPRVMAWGPEGEMLVSIPSQRRVIALTDGNNAGVADNTVIVLSDLNRPHGIAFYGGKLYVAETDGVAAYEYDRTTKKASNGRKIIDLPGGGNHFSRTIGFGADGKLYVSIGSSCNVCVEKDSRRGSIQVWDGNTLKPFATGLRNSVFFTWHPQTRELWATDMGRDLLGDDIPPEEVNIVKDGRDYGWPFCWGDRVHDDNFDRGKTHSCDATESPKIMFQAHSAPLGLAFIPDSWPEEYRGDLLVAYHGSWNRTRPTGYKVARFDLDESGKSQGESNFLSGWLGENDATGRPVDLLFNTQGDLFISDDKAGVIYRVTQT